jgi:hypothetical protein
MEIASLKDCYRIDRAWRDLGLPGEPGKICRSPFPAGHKNGDANPSFSVFADGARWKDFSTGESGSVLDLITKARGCDVAEAIRFVEDRLGIPRSEHKPDAAKKPQIPPLRRGTESELRELAERRGFNTEALRLAERRGFLWFTTFWGHSAWCITDARRALYEFRRLDGHKWPAYGRLPERKCHCLGAGKHWPIGTMESEPFAKVACVEGAPDFLAAFHFLLIEGKEQAVVPVGILGASNHALAPEALAQFKGKVVCLYPHVDDAGRTAARAWARQLNQAAASRVTAFDLSGLVLVDGREGKDLRTFAESARTVWSASENSARYCRERGVFTAPRRV